MYKKSLYNLCVEDQQDGKKLIYNTYSGSFAIFDKDTQKLINDIENINFDVVSDNQKKTIDSLFKLGFIIQKDRNEDDELKLKGRIARFSSNSISLTIATTLDCNMACPYCYENKKKIYMNQEIENKIFDFFCKSYKTQHFGYVHITWYGGEPLLQLSSIYRLSEKFISFCEENKIEYSASIITNGVLLTQEIAKKLKEECKVAVAQITIDGLPEYHNNKRILIDGRESFPIIIENVNKCKDIMNISIRVNIDYINKDNINELSKYFFYELGWGENPFIYYAPVREYENNKNRIKCISTNEFIDREIDLVKKYVNMNPCIIKDLYPKVCTPGCGSISIGSYVIDPLGDLYPCYNIVGNREERIGNVNENTLIGSRYTKWFVNEADENCYKCKLFPICGGGCPHDKLRFGKSICNQKILSAKQKLKFIYESKRND